MAKKTTAQDRKLFRAAMKDVQQLQPNKVHVKPKKPAALPKKGTKTIVAESNVQLSDHFSQTILANEYISFHRSGIQKRYLQRLAQGKLPIEASLDLHQLTIEQAREQIQRFIHTCSQQACRVIHIIHGKGLRASTQKPLLKNLTNTWLRQHPQVLAFCSAQPKHGGTGAIYVLLKRSGIT